MRTEGSDVSDVSAAVSAVSDPKFGMRAVTLAVTGCNTCCNTTVSAVSDVTHDVSLSAPRTSNS